MTEQYIGWALVVGIALGAAIAWFILGRLPRRSDEVPPDERPDESDWISRAIEARGGFAPPALVEEVLELHIRYLEGPPGDMRLVGARRPAATVPAPELPEEDPARDAPDEASAPADRPSAPPDATRAGPEGERAA